MYNNDENKKETPKDLILYIVLLKKNERVVECRVKTCQNFSVTNADAFVEIDEPTFSLAQAYCEKEEIPVNLMHLAFYNKNKNKQLVALSTEFISSNTTTLKFQYSGKEDGFMYSTQVKMNFESDQ